MGLSAALPDLPVTAKGGHGGPVHRYCHSTPLFGSAILLSGWRMPSGPSSPAPQGGSWRGVCPSSTGSTSGSQQPPAGTMSMGHRRSPSTRFQSHHDVLQESVSKSERRVREVICAKTKVDT